MNHKPEMTMFYVVKAGTLHCDNTDDITNGCVFCEYYSFCKKVVSAIKCLQTEFPNDYERIYGIITESKGVTNDPNAIKINVFEEQVSAMPRSGKRRKKVKRNEM